MEDHVKERQRPAEEDIGNDLQKEQIGAARFE